MKIKSVLKFIGSNLLLFLAIGVFISLVAVLGMVAIVLLSMLGYWIGIGEDIFVYFSMFCIFWKAYNVLAWAVNKINDRIERKNIREYFERLHKEK